MTLKLLLLVNIVIPLLLVHDDLISIRKRYWSQRKLQFGESLVT